MKNLFVLLACFGVFLGPLGAQETNGQLINLKTLKLSKKNTVHVISPEPIRYVDISSQKIAGDIPMENVLRLKVKSDSLNKEDLESELGSITVAGDNYMAQFRAVASNDDIELLAPVRYEIAPSDMVPLESSDFMLSRSQMKTLSYHLLSVPNKKPRRKEEKYGIGMYLNSISTIGDFIFLDMSFVNKTNLSFRPDQLRFFIEDKKITKATNVQSVEIDPIWQFHPFDLIKKKNRNIYVLKKITFPGTKVLRINLTEKQISGRTIDLKVRYNDILNANSL
ncbi:conserved exported hypothetical protein [Sphingobacterium sp. PM2-P1-29]|nr:conserved exported hypothetical protein [Sphingobacterium sp. PM2-P1-29]